jgi:hypothetical protein
LVVLLSAAKPPFETQTVDGRTLLGPVAELSAERLSVDTADGRVSLPTEKLLSLSAVQKSPAARSMFGVVVELVDGSSILGRQYVVQADRAKITLPDGEDMSVPTSAVQSVQFQQKSAALAAEWSRLADMKADSDLLVVFKDQTIDYHKGVLHDVTADVVRFDLDGDVLPVKRTKIYGLAYHHGAAAELPAAVCRITDASGSQWSAKSVRLAGKLEWTTPTGISVSQPVERIAKIDFSGGKLAYLSDLKPDSAVWTPYFGTAKRLPAMDQFYGPRYDRNFDLGPLRLGGVEYPKGLALHARTEIVYRLPAGFKRFQAIAGVDEAMRPAGKVRLAVRGDDKVLLEIVVAGGDAPRPIELDLTGVRRLTILAEFGESVGEGDHLLLCNARLSK